MARPDLDPDLRYHEQQVLYWKRCSREAEQHSPRSRECLREIAWHSEQKERLKHRIEDEEVHA